MTDHKTVREVLEQMKKPVPCFERLDDYDGAYKSGFNDAVDEALAALDRIEAGTDDEVLNEFEKYPELEKQIKHASAKWTNFSIKEWSDFLGALNAALIRAATAPKTTDVPCRTCNGDPETCAVPDARRVYGFHNGKDLSCHPPGVESAIETFLRFNGAVFVDGKPVEKFGIATGAMSSAIQAYLDFYRKGVGDTDETRKSY